MGNNIIYKLIKTPTHSYIYDRHTDTICMISSEEWNELENVELGKLDSCQSSVVERFQSHGMLIPNVVKTIEHPSSAIIEHYINTRMHQLILQVTQQCNLRCEYCIYSGKYAHTRTHSSKRMDFEIAKKAIDFFLLKSIDLPSVVIGFYGGEPLLEFNLIKECVKYARNCVEGKTIHFNLTTNGTLLSDEVVDYLASNDFSLAISIDGSRDEHDVNRKFANGEGSFDTIISNVRHLQKRYPEFSKHVTFLTTVNPYMDLGCALEFFSTNELFSDNLILFSSMNETHLKESAKYNEPYYLIRNYEYMKMLFSLVGKISSKSVSPLMSRSRESLIRFASGLAEHTSLSPVMHHNGPCLPGVQRLFVRFDGTLFPCERVNEKLDYYQIGTIDEGINLHNVKRILNIGKVTEGECKSCWNIRHCTICSSQLEFNTIPTLECKLSECKKSKANTLFTLRVLCVLSEFGFKAEKARFK